MEVIKRLIINTWNNKPLLFIWTCSLGLTLIHLLVMLFSGSNIFSLLLILTWGYAVIGSIIGVIYSPLKENEYATHKNQKEYHRENN